MSYHVFWIPKKSGGKRTITAPDNETKAYLKGILKTLERKEWVSRHAHGFIKYRGLVSNAEIHCGKRYIVNVDVKDFFPSIKRKHLAPVMINLFTRLLGSIQWDKCFHEDALPQGAPTSPYLSNIYMRDFDTQIRGLVRKIVSDDIEYTRYADDLTFSSNSPAVREVVGIVGDKLKRDLNLSLNQTKTRLMKPGQRQEVTGLNINSGRPTISKKYRRKVRAAVHAVACGKKISETERQSLMGKIAYIQMCHLEEGKKYKGMMLKSIGQGKPVKGGLT